MSDFCYILKSLIDLSLQDCSLAYILMHLGLILLFDILTPLVIVSKIW